MSLKIKLNYVHEHYGVTYKYIAEKAGVNYSIVRKIAVGVTSNFRDKQNQKKIEAFLEQFNYFNKEEQE